MVPAGLTWEAEEGVGASGAWKEEGDSTLEGLTQGTPSLRFSRDRRLQEVSPDPVECRGFEMPFARPIPIGLSSSITRYDLRVQDWCIVCQVALCQACTRCRQ